MGIRENILLLDLEKRVIELEARVKALLARPKPGRPPKDKKSG